MITKAGYVTILGKPNAGKSTLMNVFLNTNLSIVSPKPQTTRQRILGFYTEDNCQIIFSDTPGILNPSYKLQETMISSIEESLLDADLFLLLIEPDVLAPDNIIVEKVLAGSTPVIIAINKIDEHKQEKIEEVCNHWKRNYPQREVIPISALHRFNTDKLLEIIKSYIPEHPFYYDPEDLSDRNLRFFAAEKIREKIFLNYHKEIPYSCDVYVESYEETDKLHRISAVILVERDSQKGILIGEKGSSLKKVGTQARLDLEEFLGTKVYLELKVKVCKNWRNDINQLKKLGYIR